MLPYVNLFGLQVPTYGLSYVAAVLLFVAVSVWLAPRFGNHRADTFFSATFGVVGLIAGLKLMAAAFALPGVLAAWDSYASPWQALGALFAGNRFFGGFAGGVLGVWVYAILYKKPFSQTVENLVPGFVAAFAVVRLGCFAAGCCYGVPHAGPFGVVFAHSPFAPSGVALFPTQLCEAAFNLALFALFLWLGRRPQRPFTLLSVLIVAYAVFRFFIEFVRADGAGAAFLSVGQMICVVLLAGGVLLYAKRPPAGHKQEA